MPTYRNVVALLEDELPMFIVPFLPRVLLLPLLPIWVVSSTVDLSAVACPIVTAPEKLLFVFPKTTVPLLETPMVTLLVVPRNSLMRPLTMSLLSLYPAKVIALFPATVELRAPFKVKVAPEAPLAKILFVPSKTKSLSETSFPPADPSQRIPPEVVALPKVMAPVPMALLVSVLLPRLAAYMV